MSVFAIILYIFIPIFPSLLQFTFIYINIFYVILQMWFIYLTFSIYRNSLNWLFIGFAEMWITEYLFVIERCKSC